ncbi:quinon protein alcohol dehydrogenase-like superfamily [Suillus americanus]|nr:quinon protein alcohol dehydrogenase-like superfamily [Suillus americanus]
MDTEKIIAKWMGHKGQVKSVCWSEDGRRVLIGSYDGTAREWDVENGETTLGPIEIGHQLVWAAVYSPDMSMFATAGDDVNDSEQPIKIWDAKTGELVATSLNGHTMFCLAWTADGKTLISGRSAQRAHRLSLRHCDISEWPHPRKHIEGQDSTIMEPPERPTHHHAGNVFSVSFSADGKLLTTGCRDKNAYTWDVSAILKEAGLEDLLLDQPSKLALATINATRRPVQPIKVSNRVPRGVFDDSPHPHRSVRPDPHDAPSQSVFQWARNIFSGRPSSAQIEPHKHGSAVPYAKGKRRNASAREKRRPALKIATASSSRPPNSNATQQSSGAAQAQSSSQPQAAASTSTAPPVVANTTSSTNPHVMIRHAGRWTRFWLLICCASSEYTDGHH